MVFVGDSGKDDDGWLILLTMASAKTSEAEQATGVPTAISNGLRFTFLVL